MTSLDSAKLLRSRFTEAISEPNEFRGDASVFVERSAIVDVCRFLRDDPTLSFDMLTDICGVDYQDQEPRFEIVYHLYSYKNACWLRLKVRITEDDCACPSVTGIWRGANWHEREAYDMYGIIFTGHPDLRRILMWDRYPFHPLRKEFPLAGKEAPLPDDDIDAKAMPIPLAGGPFVSSPGGATTIEREPRAKGES
ncbi:MAG: NADH-quinone oxidoreductase subunit C [Verrucomicrobiae bacterium]|nr:NADH-quinone oxidoreductase subunit C [Verrucomicrobiae bacterium]